MNSRRTPALAIAALFLSGAALGFLQQAEANGVKVNPQFKKDVEDRLGKEQEASCFLSRSDGRERKCGFSVVRNDAAQKAYLFLDRINNILDLSRPFRVRLKLQELFKIFNRLGHISFIEIDISQLEVWVGPIGFDLGR